MSAKIRALLATARIANVPSVICNVLTGMLLVWQVSFYNPDLDSKILLTLLAGCALYVSGNFLNDWFDARWDGEHRPERAIPSGLFQRSHYLTIAIVLSTQGALMAWAVNHTVLLVYAVIAALVLSYTLVHKRHAFSIWIMGACRAGLYAMGIAAMSPNFRVIRDFIDHWQDWQGVAIITVLLVPLVGMLCYIAGISLLARYESRPNLQAGTKLIAAILLLAPLLTHSCSWATSHAFGIAITNSLIGFWGLVPFTAWTLYTIFFKASVAQKVGRLLAGIALVDSVYWLSTGLESHQFYGVPSLHFLVIPLFAFLAALLLQKIAPAT
jgi:4-hydroxybenzoate polyprenyltransferase